MTMKTPDIRLVPLAKIDPPEWDSRLPPQTAEAKRIEEKEIESLSASLQYDGLLQPIKVMEKADGRFERIFGGRREAAARVAGWSNITAIVIPEISPLDRILDNGIENSERKDLSSFEEARLCVRLREAKMSGTDVAKRMGFSPQKVSNLSNAYVKLPDPVKMDWQAGVEAVNVHALYAIATDKDLDDDGKVRAWEARKAELAKAKTEAEAAGTTVRKRRKSTPAADAIPRVGQHLFSYVSDFASSKDCPKKIGGSKEWLVALCKYLDGRRATPPVGIPNPDSVGSDA